MSFQNPDRATIGNILKSTRNIAIVGLSDDPMKPSYLVARYLKMQGYAIFPVNPKYETVLDLKCYASLAEIDRKMDIIDIFRRPEHVLPIVQEAISIKPAVIWMQLGIINEKAALIAREAGMQVVMDRCIKIDHMNM